MSMDYEGILEALSTAEFGSARFKIAFTAYYLHFQSLAAETGKRPVGEESSFQNRGLRALEARGTSCAQLRELTSAVGACKVLYIFMQAAIGAVIKGELSTLAALEHERELHLFMLTVTHTGKCPPCLVTFTREINRMIWMPAGVETKRSPQFC